MQKFHPLALLVMPSMHWAAPKSWPGKLALERVELIDAPSDDMAAAGEGEESGGVSDGSGDDGVGCGGGGERCGSGGEGRGGGGEGRGGGGDGGRSDTRPAVPDTVTSAMASKRRVPGSTSVTYEPSNGAGAHVTVCGPTVAGAVIPPH